MMSPMTLPIAPRRSARALLLVAAAAACGPAPVQHPPCAADTSCVTGSVCVDGACVPGCAADKDCRDGRLCVNGRCADAVDAATPFDAAHPDDASAIADLAVADSTPAPDLAAVDLASPDLLALDLARPDLTAVPSDSACYSGWRSLNGTCPAPVITAAYYSNSGCVGTAGMFFEGDYFEYSGPDSAGGDDGPTTGGTINYTNVTRWNMLSATAMCVTICPSCGHTGDVYVTNPDGKRSNTVTMGFR